MDKGQEQEMAGSLLSWYRGNRRILPWREDPTPYHVWISEIMLQQTRVEAVKGYYARFTEELPDIPSLAAAPEDRVLKLWEGLGYYSRARNLQKAAQVICRDYGREMPRSLAELRKLPGIGPYTAAAIASIAFGENIPAVDGNLLRVFARTSLYSDDIRSEEAKKRASAYFASLFDAAVRQQGSISGQNISTDNAESDAGTEQTAESPESKNLYSGAAAGGGPPANIPGSLNQALMDLGAGVCGPNGEPECGNCPWNRFCRAHIMTPGREIQLPVMPAKKPRRVEELTVLLVQDAGRTVLRRRPGKGLLAGMYEFPETEGHLTEEEAVRYVRGLGFEPLHVEPVGEAKHIFSHVEWHMTGYAIRVDELSEKGYDSKGGAGAVLLAETGEIRDHYSIPSAFRYYREWILNHVR